jgi:LPS-assembly protein
MERCAETLMGGFSDRLSVLVPSPYAYQNTFPLLRAVGQFAINDEWKYGWDVTALSDRYFLQDYKRYIGLNENYFFRESSSTAYLTGQGERSYFDVRGYYFQALSPNDIQQQQPITHPVVDYNRVFDVDPAKTLGLGGQIEVDANFTSTSASIANYESVQPRTLDVNTGIYNVCQIYAPAANPYNSTCLLRGVGGDYQHATASAAWKRKFIDPLDGVWTPFAFARFTGSYLDYNQTGDFLAINNAAQPIPNGAQNLFLKSDQTFRGQALPGVGAEWRFPLLARAGEFGSLVIEPIGQWRRVPTSPRFPRSSTWTRRAWCLTTPTCSNGANFPATTAMKRAFASITAGRRA